MCAKKGLFELHKVYIQRLNSIIKTIGYVLSIELARVEISLHQSCEVKYSIDGAPKQDTRYATASQKVHSPQCVKNLGCPQSQHAELRSWLFFIPRNVPNHISINFSSLNSENFTTYLV